MPDPDPGTVAANAAADLTAAEPFTTADARGDRWRMTAVRTDDATAPVVIVGGALAGVDATYLRMVTVLAIATIAVPATLLVVAWWLLRHGVRPLTATAEAIADGALSERVPAMDPRTEAGRLGDALNTMLARIGEAFRERAASEDRLRRRVARAAHTADVGPRVRGALPRRRPRRRGRR